MKMSGRIPADSEADKRMGGGGYSLIRFAGGNPMEEIPALFSEKEDGNP